MHRMWLVCIVATLAVWSFGCEPNESVPSHDDVSPTDVPVPLDTVEAGETTTDTAPTTAPAFEDLSVFGSDTIGLVAWLDITTDIPSRLTVSLEDLTTGLSTPVPYHDSLATKHAPVIMGMHAESSYKIHVTATGKSGLATVEMVDFETGTLPSFFADFEVEISDADKMQPGYTLLTINRGNEGLSTVVLDAAGEVVFYHSFIGSYLVPLPGGAYLRAPVTPSGPLTITNLLGNVGPSIHPEDHGSPSFHHLPGVTGEETYLALGLEMQTIDGYQEDGQDITYDVVGDVICEFTQSGDLVHTHSLLDALDPHRVGIGFHFPFWDMSFPGTQGGTKDWSHSNSVTSDPDDGDLVVSVLHQQWVVKLDRETGEAVWRLGADGDFELSPGGRWSASHHAATPLQGGRILLYDNEPAAPPSTSRVVEYTLDTDSGIAVQTWEYQADPPVKSQIMGEAHVLENGNVLLCDGAINSIETDNPIDPDNHPWARVVEVTYPSPSEEIFRVTIRQQVEKPGGYRIMAARRIPSLY